MNKNCINQNSMKKYIVYLIILVFALTQELSFTGCGSHRIQMRHMKHARKFSKHSMKNRARGIRRLKKRKSVRSQARHSKVKIKKYGGTYIMH